MHFPRPRIRTKFTLTVLSLYPDKISELDSSDVIWIFFFVKNVIILPFLFLFSHTRSPLSLLSLHPSLLLPVPHPVTLTLSLGNGRDRQISASKQLFIIRMLFLPFQGRAPLQGDPQAINLRQETILLSAHSPPPSPLLLLLSPFFFNRHTKHTHTTHHLQRQLTTPTTTSTTSLASSSNFFLPGTKQQRSTQTHTDTNNQTSSHTMIPIPS